jgi:hypothetical protein
MSRRGPAMSERKKSPVSMNPAALAGALLPDQLLTVYRISIVIRLQPVELVAKLQVRPDFEEIIAHSPLVSSE